MVFVKFKNDDLDTSLRSGRPSQYDEERLSALLEENGRQRSREIAKTK